MDWKPRRKRGDGSGRGRTGGNAAAQLSGEGEAGIGRPPGRPAKAIEPRGRTAPGQQESGMSVIATGDKKRPAVAGIAGWNDRRRAGTGTIEPARHDIAGITEGVHLSRHAGITGKTHHRDQQRDQGRPREAARAADKGATERRCPLAANAPGHAHPSRTSLRNAYRHPSAAAARNRRSYPRWRRTSRNRWGSQVSANTPFEASGGDDGGETAGVSAGKAPEPRLALVVRTGDHDIQRDFALGRGYQGRHQRGLSVSGCQQRPVMDDDSRSLSGQEASRV